MASLPASLIQNQLLELREQNKTNFCLQLGVCTCVYLSMHGFVLICTLVTACTAAMLMTAYIQAHTCACKCPLPATGDTQLSTSLAGRGDLSPGTGREQGPRRSS